MEGSHPYIYSETSLMEDFAMANELIIYACQGGHSTWYGDNTAVIIDYSLIASMPPTINSTNAKTPKRPPPISAKMPPIIIKIPPLFSPTAPPTMPNIHAMKLTIIRYSNPNEVELNA